MSETLYSLLNFGTNQNPTGEQTLSIVLHAPDDLMREDDGLLRPVLDVHRRVLNALETPPFSPDVIDARYDADDPAVRARQRRLILNDPPGTYHLDAFIHPPDTSNPEEGVLAGIVKLVVRHGVSGTSRGKSSILHIETLETDEAYRRYGIGSLLLRAALGYVPKDRRRTTEVFVNNYAGNPSSETFLQNSGLTLHRRPVAWPRAQRPSNAQQHSGSWRTVYQKVTDRLTSKPTYAHRILPSLDN